MDKDNLKIKGYSYPLTPGGKSSIVGDFPWHYGTEYLNILYRTDPEAIAAYLPYPLEPGPEPDLAYAAFSRWWSVWDEEKAMPSVNPERTQYMEAAIWAGCSFKNSPGQICLHIWVDNDFSMARGWFMGFPKKLGQIYMTAYHPLNPAMPEPGPGVKMKGIAAAHGERLLEGTLNIRERVSPADLPKPMGLPLLHIRHFPSIEKGAPPSVMELVSLGADDYRYGNVVWKGVGDLRFFPSEIEEHMLLAPREVLGAYHFTSGYSFPGGKVLHSWV
ncbi:MAG: acetoacetate decarboxylase family protein [Thermovirgaceae bacterium]|nr:acetoacetate decarboxylase family protein [Thermovirgaceae bacterium]